MKTLAVASQKGGVGKTTVSLNLALAFAKAGYRTVLADTDPQGAVGFSLPSARESRGLAGYLTGGSTLEDVLIRTRFEELSLLPVGPMNPQDARAFGEYLADGTRLERLAEALAPDTDLLLYDTPCGFGGVTMGVLRNADGVLSPLQAEPIAMRTLPQLLETIGYLRQDGVDVTIVGVVLTMLQLRDEVSLDVAQEAWSRLPEDLVLETTIPRDATFLKASSLGVPVGLMRKRPPPVAGVFDRLVKELEPRLGLAGVEEEDEPLDLFA